MEPVAVYRQGLDSGRREDPCGSHSNSLATRIPAEPEVPERWGWEQVTGPRAPASASSLSLPGLRDRLIAPARHARRSTGGAWGAELFASAVAGRVCEEGLGGRLPALSRRCAASLASCPLRPGERRLSGAMEDEVVRIAKKMDKMVQKKNAAGALDLLKELKNIPMTLELLQSTRIGMSVNAIRKQSTDEEVTSLAKSLIKSWKKLLDGPSTDKDSEEKKKEPAISSQNSPEAREESSSSGNVSSRKDETNARDTYVSSFPRAPSTSDSVRLKCREMLAAALRTGDDYVAIGADEEELGSQIEEAIYQEIRNTDMKYKNRVRSRISNLKDAKNPNLRKNVLCGNIPPDLFARMTAEEMASDELKEMRKNLTKEAIREHQMAKTGGTQTDLFTCGKCKKKNCTYTQVQTRSADEPMTTFVVCNECGNRWKFC